ncbi:MAG TPA: amino acid permease, partial [Elusimicrobiota bacterium]|nr:amino acid permease [Elusimicrobiota bacterium]
MGEMKAPSLSERLKRLFLGAPRDIRDPHVYQHVSLIALLAWVGLGADGLSSSCYGPEESFKVLGEHTYLAVFLAVGIVATVFIISYAYSRVIEHFPFGGGGYTVASRLLGPKFGLVSGGALLTDYFLTITVSVASGMDALFSFLPPHWARWKLACAAAAILVLMVLNLRGVKESILAVAPVFGLFVLTHLILIFGAFLVNAGRLPHLASQVHSGFRSGLSTLGFFGMAALFLRAYAMGAGTYTGIEAVSNGLAIMREPKVETGKRTMVLMAASLAFTAGGIILGYLLVGARPVAGQTMNAVLAGSLVARAGLGGSLLGKAFIALTLLAEAALLVIAAQAGFMDGPRIMANMAHDSWMPRRFGTLSDRLTVQDGVLVMAGAALLLLFHTRGDVTTLVVMYSINVFLTFCLTEASMIRFWLAERSRHADWRKKISVHVAGFVICLSMLILNLVMKFAQGGWETVVITGGIIGACLLIRRHYDGVQKSLARLDEILGGLPVQAGAQGSAVDAKAPTAILLVGGYAGLGVHALLSIQRLFPGHFKNFIFISVGVIDAASFKGVEAVDEVRARTETALRRYVDLARGEGLAADWRMSVGTEVGEEAEELCLKTAQEFPRSIVFAGKLVFQREHWFDRFLHNETAYALQRRLQFKGLNAMVLPVRVMAGTAAVLLCLLFAAPVRADDADLRSRVELLEKRLAELAPKPASAPAAPRAAEPFGFADFTWLNGNSRTHSSPMETEYFTGEFRVDANYNYSANHPRDHVIDGACEVSRHNELQLQQLGIGGDFHYQNVRGRLMTQFGLYSQ